MGQDADAVYAGKRVDVAHAVQDGGVVIPTGDAAKVSMALPWTPWVFHMLDYI